MDEKQWIRCRIANMSNEQRWVALLACAEGHDISEALAIADEWEQNRRRMADGQTRDPAST